jgi:type IV protein arginine methyltransferase
MFQSLPIRPIQHVIVEPHPDVLAHMREKGWYEKPGVRILEGLWQDFVLDTNESDDMDTGLLTLSEGGFDVIYIDTFSESYRGICFASPDVTRLLRRDSRALSVLRTRAQPLARWRLKM